MSIERKETMKSPLTLSIEGMHCGACVRRVTAALLAVDGVELTSVKVGTAELSFNPKETAPEDIADAVNRIGFQAKASR
jgi:copper chaperone